MSQKNCADPGIAPQALPPSGTHLNQVPYQFSSFDGDRVSYTQVNEPLHRVNRFPRDQKPGDRNVSILSYPGIYRSGMVCARGITNIDNRCLCPGSADTMPFNHQPPTTTAAVTNMLFSPFLPGAIPELTASAQQLVRERSRLPPKAGSYYQLDAPLPCPGGSAY